MLKILVADDSRLQVALLRKALLEDGFEVVVAEDALQAGMLALRAAPDAIILDINMPGGSGIEVLKRLRRSTKTQHIPVLVVSGNNDLDIRQVAMELGVAEFLPKPVDLCHLRKAMSTGLPPCGDGSLDKKSS
jgi:two-component system cell cycle response regulator